MLDVGTGLSTLVTNDSHASEPRWFGGGHELLWLKHTDNGNTSFIVAHAEEVGKIYTAGTVPGPISNLKTYMIEPGMIAIAASGPANPDGSLHNPKDTKPQPSSGRLYDQLFVRHWDTYVESDRSTIWTGLLQKGNSHVMGKEGRYGLIGFKNALRGTNLESPIPPFGGKDHFDIGSQGLVIVAKDPHLNPATHTKCSAYFIPKSDVMDMNTPVPRKLEVVGLDGAATSPMFSPDGRSVAFLQMRTDGYESDKNQIVVYEGLDGLSEAKFTVLHGTEGWDRSPSSIMFTQDGKSLLLQVEDTGRGCLFKIDLEDPGHDPKKLTSTGYINDIAYAAVGSDKLFISSTNLVDNKVYTLLDPDAPDDAITVSTSTKDGAMFGLSPTQVEEIWWKGAGGHPVHAWMVKPSFFKKDQKYPLAYLIHGGPQGAWGDQWSTRWNPAVFAEQGYIAICPNPTGSTGYGQLFTDAIRNEWGGLPYEDLVKGFEYIESDLTFVDTDRAVALGASYGGYMMNWFQGHELGRKFKALVCHDGVFSMTAQLASDEQYFPIHDLGGPIWDRQEVYDKWDPSRFLKNWRTPMLVIHNELDYRLTIAEGLAAFNVLQIKGVESRFLSFPDENHWVLKEENSLVWHHTVINFINKFTGLPQLVNRHGGNGCLSER